MICCDHDICCDHVTCYDHGTCCDHVACSCEHRLYIGFASVLPINLCTIVMDIAQHTLRTILLFHAVSRTVGTAVSSVLHSTAVSSVLQTGLSTAAATSFGLGTGAGTQPEGTVGGQGIDDGESNIGLLALLALPIIVLGMVLLLIYIRRQRNAAMP